MLDQDRNRRTGFPAASTNLSGPEVGCGARLGCVNKLRLRSMTFADAHRVSSAFARIG